MTATADYPRPPLEAYGKLPLKSSACLSPDGIKVAAVANVDAGTRIIIFEVGGAVPKQVGIEDSKARGIKFYDNDHVIVRASETVTTYGFRGDYEYSGAYSIRLSDDHTHQLLTKARDLFPAQGGLGRIIGRGKTESEVLMPVFVGESHQDPSLDLKNVDLDTGRVRRAETGTPDTIDWFTDGGGKAIARERFDDKRDVYQIQIPGSKWETIYKEENVTTPPIWISGLLPDGSGLVFTTSAEAANGFDHLMTLGFDGVVSGPILARENKEIDEIYLDNDRRLVGVAYSGSVPEYEFLDSALGDNLTGLQAQLPDAIVRPIAWSTSRDRVLYYVDDFSMGEPYVVFEMSSQEISVISRYRPDLPPEAVGLTAAIEYKARDGLTIPAIVVIPPDVSIADKPNLPMIVRCLPRTSTHASSRSRPSAT